MKYILLKLFLTLLILNACKQTTEDNSQELSSKRTETSEKIGNISSQIYLVIRQASPIADTALLTKQLNEYFAELTTIYEVADSTNKERARLTLDNKDALYKQYYKNLNSIIGTGIINTVDDGYDVREVNVWSSVENSRRVVGSLINREKVDVITQSGEYYYVKSRQRNTQGYLMKDWVTGIQKK